MARGAAVAALLQLAVVCSVAVSIQYAPGEGDGLTGNATVAEDGEGGTSRFTVRIKVPKGKSASKEPQAKLMGWQLGSEAGGPVRVLKIRGKGIVARHNADNAERPIVAGDELVEVNGVKWNGDNRAFEALLGKEIQATMKSKEKTPLLRLTLQRRRKQIDQRARKALEREKRSRERRETRKEKASVSAGTQEKDRTSKEKISASAGVREGREVRERKASGSAGVHVDRAISNVEGLVAAWNRLHPEDAIELNRETFHKAMKTSLATNGHGEHERRRSLVVNMAAVGSGERAAVGPAGVSRPGAAGAEDPFSMASR